MYLSDYRAATAASRRETPVVALVYLLLTLGFTWPLARGLTHHVPGDFGDPLLNAWIVSWGATHIGRGWWDANIFFPHPWSLGYSEHLLPQVLQSMPIHAATGNPILCYNLLFLSTFVLSGVGAFLFAREITASRAAAVVAGTAYAFAPYRVTSIPHLQVLSSQWMPFALYGFRRFFDRVSHLSNPTRAELEEHAEKSLALRGPRILRETVAPLAGGAAAWLLQNLSCGYHMFFFSPIVAAYILWEITTRSLWGNRFIVGAALSASALVALVTLIFMVPYIELRHLGFSPRSLDETTKFSADVYAYLTADPNLHVWGRLVQAWPHPEGALFPGFTIVALAVVACALAAAGPAARLKAPRCAVVKPAMLLAPLALLVALLFGWTIRVPGVKIASFPRAFVIITMLYALVLMASPAARRILRLWLATPAGLFTVVALFAIAMSLGPSIHAKGRIVASTNLYALFYNFVPGFDGLRVPARFGMVATLALALLAGIGVASLRKSSAELAVAIVAAGAIVVESLAIPIPIDQNSVEYRQPGLAPLPASLGETPPVYGFVATLPQTAAVIELPLGEPAFDVRYMFYSTAHWRRLVNGYSGGAPAEYERLDQALQDFLTRPDRAWQALADTRASYAIVHQAFYTGDRGMKVSEWLRSSGAREVAAFGADRIFRMP